MLKLNSKKARENIRRYIMDYFDPSNYEDVNQNPETFEETARIILDTFQAEKYYSLEQIKKYSIPVYNVFRDWCQGLPSILNTCYYWNRSAVDDLGAILEESDAEKSKYSESDACELLTRIIYNELERGARK